MKDSTDFFSLTRALLDGYLTKWFFLVVLKT